MTSSSAGTTQRWSPALQNVFRTAQPARGKGLWSDADPEVWADSTFVVRLGRGRRGPL